MRVPKEENDNIGKRLVRIRKLLRLNQEQFAHKLGLSQSGLSQIENGSINLSLPNLLDICRAFQVNPEFILFGQEPIIADGNYIPPSDRGIPLIKADAHADYPKNIKKPDFLREQQKYILPGYEGENLRMFEVNGDSMEPTINDGDFVVVEPSDNKKIKVGGVYVLVTEKGVLLKRLYKIKENSLILHSDNPEYQTTEIQVDELLEFWKVNGRLTGDVALKSAKDSERLSLLEERISNLEKAISRNK